MFWGSNNLNTMSNLQVVKQKRKYDELSQEEDVSSAAVPTKYELYNSMIVSNGDEVRFTTEVNEYTIEILIK